MAITLRTLFFVILNVLIASFSLDVSAEEGGWRDGPGHRGGPGGREDPGHRGGHRGGEDPGHRDGPIGSWRPITDPNAYYITEIGRFAIKEHNTRARSYLEFERVIKGEEQGILETRFKLIIVARNHIDTSRYEVVVLDKPLRVLLEFNQI
ncbi:hypothetical protein LIER_21585 [Lithospermum erythrorhizon]|uniref:Cystatin domain-containing protein n=1 Tax=Lithospermum erythrorhizon TaxID=34254 RepID=A0AAV3QTV3_LITER